MRTENHLAEKQKTILLSAPGTKRRTTLMTFHSLLRKDFVFIFYHTIGKFTNKLCYANACEFENQSTTPIILSFNISFPSLYILLTGQIPMMGWVEVFWVVSYFNQPVFGSSQFVIRVLILHIAVIVLTCFNLFPIHRTMC